VAWSGEDSQQGAVNLPRKARKSSQFAFRQPDCRDSVEHRSAELPAEPGEQRALPYGARPGEDHDRFLGDTLRDNFEKPPWAQSADGVHELQATSRARTSWFADYVPGEAASEQLLTW
jgi:hypothetical protein